MRHYINTYLDIILINVISLIIGLCFYYEADEHQIELLGAILATGISLSIGYRQLKVENDKIFKELFKEFNERYNTEFHTKLTQIDMDYLESPDEFYYKKIDPEFINEYMNLCAEEYLWFRKGRIPQSVWDAWENGMLYYFNLAPFNFWVLNQKSDVDTHYGLFIRIGHKIDNWKDHH